MFENVKTFKVAKALKIVIFHKTSNFELQVSIKLAPTININHGQRRRVCSGLACPDGARHAANRRRDSRVTRQKTRRELVLSLLVHTYAYVKT